MPTEVFVNLPVTDLDRTIAFSQALGFEVNWDFTNEKAACIVVDPGHISLMPLTRDFFATFTDKPVAGSATTVQVLTALSVDSRDAVDGMIAKGVAAGGRELFPAQDLGFMSSRDLADPDGNTFEFLWMDPAAAQDGPPES